MDKPTTPATPATPVMPPLPPLAGLGSDPASAAEPITKDAGPGSFFSRVLSHKQLPYPGKFDDLSKESRGALQI
jgi:hypothetical protein